MRDRSQARCVLVQPQMATVLMIVADVSSHEPDEMTCAENHDVLKELATAAADPVLCQNSVQPASTKELRLSKSGSNSSRRTGYTAGTNI